VSDALFGALGPEKRHAHPLDQFCGMPDMRGQSQELSTKARVAGIDSAWPSVMKPTVSDARGSL
jgi:hypothetical protein